MTSEDELKRDIDMFIDTLKKTEKSLNRIGMAAGVGASVVLGILLLIMVSTDREDAMSFSEWVVIVVLVIILYLYIGRQIGAGVKQLAMIPAEKRLRADYTLRFTNPDVRRSADRLLAAVEVQRIFLPESGHYLIKEMKILERIRGNLLGITYGFICSQCNAHVECDHMGQVIQCKRCKTELIVPSNPHCPKCGKQTCLIVTPEQQVAPLRNESKGKVAGGLIYGPVGIIAGALLDFIVRLPKLAIRQASVATARHLYYCGECGSKWAVRLPVATELDLKKPNICLGCEKYNTTCPYGTDQQAIRCSEFVKDTQGANNRTL